MTDIILASGSPRRRALLEGAGFKVKVVKPDFDESGVYETDPQKLVRALALGKNNSVRVPDGIVLSADTVVCLDGEILGKPRGFESAYRMLRSLSGNTHRVFTGVCITFGKKQSLFCESADVTFYNLSDRSIIEYIESGAPFDKAGGYGIQDDAGGAFVKHIEGDITCVIGLPMAAVTEQINSLTKEI